MRIVHTFKNIQVASLLAGDYLVEAIGATALIPADDYDWIEDEDRTEEDFIRRYPAVDDIV